MILQPGARRVVPVVRLLKLATGPASTVAPTLTVEEMQAGDAIRARLPLEPFWPLLPAATTVAMPWALSAFTADGDGGVLAVAAPA